MRGNPLATVEQFDRAGGDARPDLLAQQAMGNRVVVLVDLDVVVEPNRKSISKPKVTASTSKSSER